MPRPRTRPLNPKPQIRMQPHRSQGKPPTTPQALKNRIAELEIANDLLVDERMQYYRALERAINALGFILLRQDADPVGAEAARYALRDLLDLL